MIVRTDDQRSINQLKPTVMGWIGERTRFLSGGGGGGAGGTSGEVPPHALDDHIGALSWSRVSKVGSSVADLLSRGHELLANLTSRDDHTQYMHNANARTVTAVHTFNPPSAGPAFALGANATGRKIPGLNADQLDGLDESIFMRRIATSNLDMNGFIITSPNADSQHLLGRAVLGNVGHTGYGGFAARGQANATDYALIQNATTGAVYLNRPTGQPLSFRLNNVTQMYLESAGLYLGDGQILRSNSFTSGFTGGGFRLDYDASRAGLATLELDEINVRGRMVVHELLLHRIRATNGDIFVTSGAKVGTVSGSGPYTITCEQDHGVLEDDLLLSQQFTGTGIYQSKLTVTSVANLKTFVAALLAGSDAPAVGMEYVRVGNLTDTSRQGGLYLSSDDTGAPFLNIWDGVNSWSAWNGTAKNKIRLGKLTGISGSGYGLVAGSNLGSATTTALDLRSDGTARFGPLGSGLPNVYWDGSTLRFRINTSTFAFLNTTEFGMQTGDGVRRITLTAAGEAYIAGVLTIGTSGEIRQGTGALGTDFTGLRLRRVGSMGRWSSYSGDEENVTFDDDGLSFATNLTTSPVHPKSLAWWNDINTRTGTPVAEIYTRRTGVTGSHDLWLSNYGLDATYPEGIVSLKAWRYDGSQANTLTLFSSGTAQLSGNLRVDGALHDSTYGTWHALTPATGWANVGGSLSVLAVRMFGDQVALKGRCDYSSGGSVNRIVTLAAGYRPSEDLTVVCPSSLSGVVAGREVRVRANGDVGPSGWTPVSGDWVSLDGVVYYL